MFTVIFLVKRKTGMSQAEFTDYWINQHTPMTASTPGVVSYRCYPMTGHPEGAPPPFEAVAVLSFTDRAAWDAALEGPEFQAALADAVVFQNTDETKSFFAEEHVIV